MLHRLIFNVFVRHDRAIIAGWLLLTAIAVPFALRLPQVLGDHGLSASGPYRQAAAVMAREFHLPDEPVEALFENRSGLSEREFLAAVARLLNQAERISGVHVVSTPLEQRQLVRGTHAYARLSVPGSIRDRREAIARLRERLSADGGAVGVTLTGKPVVQEAVNLSSKRDVMAAERIGLPVALALLAMALGGLLPAFIPLLAGGVSVIIAMAVVCGIGKTGAVPLSVFVYHVIPMAGLAVCIDLALLTASRFREEKARLPDPEALLAAMRTAGKTVLLSLGCVIPAALAGFFIRMPMFQSVALGSFVVLIVSGLVNLTFVPALLHACRRRIRGRVRPAGRAQQWFIQVVLKRPARSALLAAAVLTACMLPLRGFATAVPGPESLPPDQPERAAAERIRALFYPRGASLVYLVVNGGAGSAEQLRAELEQDPLVLRAFMIPARRSGGHDLIGVWLRGDENAAEVARWVRGQASRLDPAIAAVGGEAKYRQEVMDEIHGRIGFMAGAVAAANFAVLAFAFRSLLIPLKAVLMNLITIGSALGLLSWVFEGGKFGMEKGDIAVMIPVWLFALVFGISMDYGIFLLARINERYRATRDLDRAIREGLTASGTVIVSAAAIMIAVTAPFSQAGVAGVKQLGLGIAAALFLDATLVRMVLVPALMKMLGQWNWWLPFARTRL